jgi:hypothetical protein
MDREAKTHQLLALRAQVEQLERELTEPREQAWPPRGHYTAYHAAAGFVLGMFGALASLLFNVVGSALVGQHPLRLIQVYLTFPLGERALAIDSGLALAVGCCLYLGTGMLLGIPFHLVLSRWFDRSSFLARFGVVSAMSLGLWVINFYAILFWLQPLLIGGNWIVEQIPWWVGALTHLVFGWTMLVVDPLGGFTPYGTHEERA